MRPSSLLLALAAGCLAPATPPDASTDVAPDAALPPPRVVDWRVLDHEGRPWPAEDAPRRPIVELDLSRPIGLDAVYLFGPRAQAFEDLEDDLARAPLRLVNERARVPVEILRNGSSLRVMPGALEAEQTYVIAVASWAASVEDGSTVETTFLASLRIAGEEAGALVADTWPGDGAAAVPTGLRFAAVRFDDAVRSVEGVRLEGPEGVVRTQAERTECGVVGWPGGDCVVVTWEGSLEPHRRYEIVIDEGVTDRGGAPIGPWRSSFETGSDALAEVHLLETTCGLDEAALGPFCVLIDDGQVALRGLADVPVRAFLDVGARRSSAVAPRGELALGVGGLAADTAYTLRLTLEEASGTTFVESLEVRTTPPLPEVTITEVRADARGPEPRQEYIELLNSGAVPVPLQRWTLSDRVDREGDVLGAVPALAPGARALLVAAAFDPAHPDDPTVPEGVPLIRVDGTLASGGLSNAGEPLYLRDHEGRRVSYVPAMAAPGAGICWVRRGAGRGGAPSDFFAAPCTPGRDTPPP